MSRRQSFTERRRARLARRIAQLDALEPRNTITESLWSLGMGIGFSAPLAAVGAMTAGQKTPSPSSRWPALTARDSQAHQARSYAQRLRLAEHGSAATRSAATVEIFATRKPVSRTTQDRDWLTLEVTPAHQRRHHAKPAHTKHAPLSQAGSSSMPRGGVNTLHRGAITPFRVAPPAAPQADPASAMVATALISANTSLAAQKPTGIASPAAPGGSAVTSTASGPLRLDAFPASGGGTTTGKGGGRLTGPSSGSPQALGQFTNFPLYTLDMNDGSVLFPGAYQLSTKGTNVDLRAQVRDTTVSSYSWDTSGLTGDVTNLSATNTYKLTFRWTGGSQTTHVDTLTLTVTNNANKTEVQTYDFLIPASSTYSGGGINAPSWPEAIEPNLVLPYAPSFQNHYVSVDSTSGSLDATIALPSYNPTIAPVVLTYDSMASDPRPIVVEHHTLDDTQSIPTKDSASLTFNGTAGGTYYFDTSQFIPGDIQQVGLQADATSLSTGRYGYTVTVADYRATTTTTTVSGTATVLNQASSPIGSGWEVQGLEQITSATGGVILDVGWGGKTLWFTGAGGTYTDPGGDFSTLVQNSGGTYTRTMPDGTVYNFDSNGRETSLVDRNGLRTTFSYDGSGKLTQITDPYSKVVTFAYDVNNKLQTITDPANRVTTIAHTGNNLTSATLPDSAVWSYGYDGSGRLTSLTDPRSKIVTVVYDAANRVGTITRPDSTNETFVSYQKRGYDTSGTSGSPAHATLLAEARASDTDPNSHTYDLRPDWRGMGLTNTTVDPDGNVSTADRDANGLATITIDRLNQITQRVFDSKGNVLTLTYPDGNSEVYTYNSFAEPLTHTDPLNHTTTLTYDANGNNTVIQDALSNLTTMTYTANGKLATYKDANSNVTSFQYDSQDRLTTITYPGTGTPTRLFAYDSKGNATTVTDERGNATTYSFDALNRTTGMTDALANRTTYTLDSGGNVTVIQTPTPTGQTARTTTYAYDSMNRLTTVTAPLSLVTVRGYDSGGNLKTVTDPLSRTTTIAYDPEDRPTVVTRPLTGTQNAVTTTTYDAEGQVTQVADPLNRITTATYNSRGWVATVKDPLGNVTTYTYTATGKRATQSDPSGGGTLSAYSYDSDDRLISITDALSHIVTYGYDAVGNRTSVKDANSNITTYAFDARNRLTTVTDALSHSTVSGYDSGGNRVTVTDALNHTTTYGFDALNRTTTITDARSAVTTMAFDAAGRITGLTDPNGNRTTWAYDAADRVTTITSPVYLNGSATTATTTFVYDSGGQLTDRTDRNARRVTFAYDSGGRRTNERWLDSSGGTVRTLTYTYDADDELTGVTDPDATLTFTYDSGGNQLTAVTSSAAGQPLVTLTFGYNQDHDRTSRSDSLSGTGGAGQGLTTYQYDAAHRLTTLTQSFGGTNGPQVVFGYDPANRPTSLSRTIGGTGTAVNTTLSYDNADRLMTITHQVGGGSILATYLYAYDNANRVTTETNAEGMVTYTYDNADQLTAAGGSRTESYGYDSGGNRNTTGYTVPANSGNEMTASPGETYTYDAESNVSGKTDTGTGNTWQYTWDYRNRLTGVTEKNSSGTVIMQATYTYDALDRRIDTNVDPDGGGPRPAVQTWFVYDDANPYGDFNGTGAILKRYLYGLAVDQVFSRTDSGGTSAWYLTEDLGRVRDIANASGTVIDHLVYDSFGAVTNETSPSNGDRFRFTAREYDSVTSLYADRARYYDPATGRFLSQDPVGFSAADPNLYRYANNAPTNFTDPTGHEYESGGRVPSSSAYSYRGETHNYELFGKRVRMYVPYYRDPLDRQFVVFSNPNYPNGPGASYVYFYISRTGPDYYYIVGYSGNILGGPFLPPVPFTPPYHYRPYPGRRPAPPYPIPSYGAPYTGPYGGGYTPPWEQP